MAKLYFRYGSVGSAKTLNLLAVAHNYRQQGKRVLLMKPALDQRFGERWVRSRAGLQQEADVLLHGDSVLDTSLMSGVDCILVDEAQFLSKSVIEQLRTIATHQQVPVICYGLRTDFRTHLFEGSQRLLELADSIEEVKTTCSFCAKKAIMNLKHIDGLATQTGPSIELGADELYLPVCYACFSARVDQHQGWCDEVSAEVSSRSEVTNLAISNRGEERYRDFDTIPLDAPS